MKLTPILALGALLACLFSGSASAATINVPADQATIQAAINAASDGDVVLVAPGTYNEQIDFGGKAITVKSTGGAAVTILDGSGHPGSIVSFVTGEGNASVLQGFTIANGYAVDYGGAILVGGSSPSILDNVFLNNQDCGFYPGAAVRGINASPEILRNYFSGNGCTQRPVPGQSPSETDVVAFDGGSSPVLADNVFVNNPAAAYAQSLSSYSTPSVYNNTFVGNDDGIVLKVTDVTGALFENNLIAFNYYGLSVTFSNGASLPTWSHNLVYDDTTADYAGVTDQTGSSGNLSAAPNMKDWGDGDVHLLSSSPAIDAGDGAVTQASATDFYGNTRDYDGDSDGTAIVDIGAAESVVPDNGQPASTIIHVPADQLTIQKGIDAAHNTYTVLVAPGTYYEKLNFNGKPITLKSSGGAAVTILDGSNGGPIVEFNTWEGNASVLQGFTLTHVVDSGVTGFAAVSMTYASPTIEDNVFVDNNDASSFGSGSAIFGYWSSAIIIRNYFVNNQGTNGVDSPNTVVILNEASPIVADNVFVNNSAIACREQMLAGVAPQTYNNTFVGNTEGLSADIKVPGVFSNNLIAFNQVGVDIFFDGTPIAFTNNLVFGNTTADYQELNIANQTGISGNISVDPQLSDWSTGGAHVLYGSPAIDAGDATVIQASGTDFYGDARVATGTPNGSAVVDIGAAEYQPPVVSAAAGSLQVIANITKIGTLATSGADSTEPLTFAITSLPAHGTLTLTDSVTGAFQYAPATGYLGPDTFAFDVTDPYGAVSAPATVQITVADPAASVHGGNVSTRAGSAVSSTLTAKPAYAGQTWSFVLTASPAHGVVNLDAATGRFVYMPAAGFAGTDSFSFQAKDQIGTLSGAADEDVTVTDMAPVAQLGSLAAHPGRSVSGKLRGTIAYAGQVLTFSVVSQPAHGRLTVDTATGAYTYTAPAGKGFGKDSFSFKVTDQWGTVSNVAVVRIVIL